MDPSVSCPEPCHFLHLRALPGVCRTPVPPPALGPCPQPSLGFTPRHPHLLTHRVSCCPFCFSDSLYPLPSASHQAALRASERVSKRKPQGGRALALPPSSGLRAARGRERAVIRVCATVTNVFLLPVQVVNGRAPQHPSPAPAVLGESVVYLCPVCLCYLQIFVLFFVEEKHLQNIQSCCKTLKYNIVI